MIHNQNSWHSEKATLWKLHKDYHFIASIMEERMKKQNMVDFKDGTSAACDSTAMST